MTKRTGRPTIRILPGLLFIVFMAGLGPAHAALLRNVPTTVTQPDGSVLHCFLSGDEYDHYMHDASGFVIVQDRPGGWYVYADLVNGQLEPTAHVVGRTDPVSVGLRPNLRRPAQEAQRRQELLQRRPSAPRPMSSGISAPATMNNLVIFIRFSDDSEFPETAVQFDSLFNLQGPRANSLSDFYQAVSYGQFDIRSTFYPASAGRVLSYQADSARAYYQPYGPGNPRGYHDINTDGPQRLHALLRAAASAVASQVPPGLDVDMNGDGEVDNVCYVCRGAPDTWNDMLWPHMWEVEPDPNHDAYINGKVVRTYNFHLESFLIDPSWGAGVVCHEMFHSLGAPDLYHYNSSVQYLDPVGAWDLMDITANPPQEMGAYMKYRYGGWLSDIPRITRTGLYSLHPLASSSGNCYQIASPNSSTEYFVLEYRRRSSSIFEGQLPGDGLLAYRINTTIPAGLGDAQGPPDEVYIYRPGGGSGLHANGILEDANFSAQTGRTAFRDTTDPPDSLSDGKLGGIDISEIGAVGDSITFRVTFPGGEASCPTVAGDANGDSLVDARDLVAVVNEILHTRPIPDTHWVCADLDGNQQVDLADLHWLVETILFHTPALPQRIPSLVAGTGEAAPVAWYLDQTGSTVRLHLDGRRLFGLEVAFPLPAGGLGTASPDLLGASAAAQFAWGASGDSCRALAFNPQNRPLGEGWLTLTMPAPAGAAGPSAGVRAAGPADPNAPASAAPPRCVLLNLEGEPLALQPLPSTPEEMPPVRPAVRLSGIRPNPASGPVTLHYDLAMESGVSLLIVDAAGRVVRRLPEGRQAAGAHSIQWDGNDEAARPVSAGLYLVRLVAGGSRDGGRILILR